MTDIPLHGATAALRAEFDAAFAVRPAERADSVSLLAIRVGGEPFAVRLLEAAGLVATRRIVPVPSRRGELLGVAGLRGEVIPVYGLARLVLRAEDTEPPRWLILAGDQSRVAFAFATFEGHLVVPVNELHAADRGHAIHHVTAMHAGSQPRAILSLPSLVAAVTGAERENP